MRIAITGARGFTGRFLRDAVQYHGHVSIPITSNLTDKDSLSAEVQSMDFDVVVHLAAIAFVGQSDEKAFYDVNVVGTTNLLSALSRKSKSLQKILIASSANIYGNTLRSPISETDVAAPVNHYAASKMAMEFMARSYCDCLPLVIARPFNYTGPGQDVNFVIPKIVQAYKEKRAFLELGNLDVEREFNDVRMICDAYLALLEIGETGETYNVCTGSTYTLRSILDLVSSLSGHQLDIRINPAFVRPNEIKILCGNPSKLNTLLAKQGKKIFQAPISTTLRDMMEA